MIWLMVYRERRIKPLATPGNSLAAKLKWIPDSKIAVERKGNYLKKDRTTFNRKNRTTHRNVVSLLVV